MKKWIALALSLVLCLGVLAGCGGTNNGTNGEAEGESGEKTLTVAVSKEPASLIPYESNDTGTSPITHQYCEPLLTVDTNMELQPLTTASTCGRASPSTMAPPLQPRMCSSAWSSGRHLPQPPSC